MELLKSSYETIFIIDLRNGEDVVKATVEKFLNLIKENGEIKQISEWGKRRLAYPINDLNEGYYVLVSFDAPADFPLELERIYNITEDIMRSMIIKIEAKKTKKVEAVKPVQAAEVKVVEKVDESNNAETNANANENNAE